MVDREVREVEEHVAHPRVLPVDDPDSPAVVDEVRVEEVVVARPLWRGAAQLLDPPCDLPRPGVRGRHLGAAIERRRAVVLDDPERVEASRDGRPGVHRPEGVRDALERLGLTHPLERWDRAFEEARHEPALRFEEVDDLGPDADRCGGPRRLELGPAVDPEQLGPLPGNAEDEHPVGTRHLQVVVRDPPAENLPARLPVGPDTRDDGLEARAHDRTRSPSGSKSGSAVTAPSTHVPKISTATSVWTSCSAGR